MTDAKLVGVLLCYEPKRLRQFYATVLNTAQQNPAIVNGEYIDLTSPNIQMKNFGEDVHVFLRWQEENRLLIVSNFSAKPKKIKLTIPAEVAKNVNFKEFFRAKDLLWGEQEIEFTNFTAEVELGGYGAFIFNVQ
jgi:hypothetical protein